MEGSRAELKVPKPRVCFKACSLGPAEVTGLSQEFNKSSFGRNQQKSLFSSLFFLPLFHCASLPPWEENPILQASLLADKSLGHCLWQQ
ncbi:hypothetical protein QQP08_013920, partial [Theobroma cacao]